MNHSSYIIPYISSLSEPEDIDIIAESHLVNTLPPQDTSITPEAPSDHLSHDVLVSHDLVGDDFPQPTSTSFPSTSHIDTLVAISSDDEPLRQPNSQSIESTVVDSEDDILEDFDDPYRRDEWEGRKTNPAGVASLPTIMTAEEKLKSRRGSGSEIQDPMQDHKDSFIEFSQKDLRVFKAVFNKRYKEKEQVKSRMIKREKEIQKEIKNEVEDGEKLSLTEVAKRLERRSTEDPDMEALVKELRNS